jgi:hypothetical protein
MQAVQSLRGREHQRYIHGAKGSRAGCLTSGQPNPNMEHTMRYLAYPFYWLDLFFDKINEHVNNLHCERDA